MVLEIVKLDYQLNWELFFLSYVKTRELVEKEYVGVLNNLSELPLVVH